MADGGAEVEDGGAADPSEDTINLDDGTAETTDDVEKEADIEEELDTAAENADKVGVKDIQEAEGTAKEKAESAAKNSVEYRGAKQIEKSAGDVKLPKGGDSSSKGDAKQFRQTKAEDTPPVAPKEEPFDYMYSESDAVARDAELRRGVEFHPQGTKPDIDMTVQEQFRTDTFFSQDPSIFGHCVLIRDFAEPLRVGSALIERSASSLRGGSTHHHHRHHRGHAKAPKAVAQRTKTTQALLQQPPERFVAFATTETTHQKPFMTPGKKSDGLDDDKLPLELLKPKGGVIDRDVGQKIKSNGSVEDDAEMEVSMFAFLRSIAGEVAVIPNGGIAKWSSKKKVPIAGYLCTTELGPVLHTLPTPCLPTSLDEMGQPFTPPHYRADKKDSNAPKGAPKAPESQSMQAPAPAAPADSDDSLEDQAEKEAADAEATANGPGTSMLQMKRGGRRRRRKEEKEEVAVAKSAGGPAPAPASSPGAAPGSNELPKPRDEPFHVWVGTTLLEFRSKPKAERFCKRLTKRIAEDLGDTEWDSDRVQPAEVDKVDMSVANFMLHSRKAAPEWTKGTKTCLVVVMDWMRGDSSKAPYSEQSSTPKHYQEKVFPKVRQAFQRMSYGQFDLAVTVVPEVVPFSKPRSRYTAGGYPFPGLYNGAKDSIEGSIKFSDKYQFNKYDLVYVISPQQAPTGTKGVAWVGAKGAMCNGCEAISENFQVMVAVHELGHNLGLWHASSKSLEYGNVFDWMGNYPDVTGLSYGLGYKLRLNWLSQSSIAKIEDADVSSLNDEYLIMPVDSKAAPVGGQLTGIQINLEGNRRDIYVSYRKEPGQGRAGIFLTWQDRDKPNSELIDCACHSPSQQDAALQQGWTFMEPSGKLVIHALKVEGDLAIIRIYKAPSSKDVASIRGRKGFTDGQYKCPRVCTDADLLVSTYKGCAMLAADGYCGGGSITMSGTKFTVGQDLCPKSCDQCSAVTSGSATTGSSAGCADKNVKISGMTCPQASAKGYCDYATNIGHIGDDLCPSSCGRCPSVPSSPGGSGGNFADPKPARTHGLRATSANDKPVTPESEKARHDAAAEKEKSEEGSAQGQENEEEKKAETDDMTCTDDTVWSDADGDGCQVYANYIANKKLTKEEACTYGDGAAANHCRKTCDTCKAASFATTCEDKECVVRWRHERGKCFACNEWANHCDKDFFAHDCPQTCGLCKADASIEKAPPPLPTRPMIPATTTPAPTMPPTMPPTLPPACEDHECVDSWMKSFGVCHKCRDFAEDYCGRDESFMQSCPKSCRICQDAGEVDCHDDFLPHTCKRYVDWGWCTTPHIAEHCRASCGFCGLIDEKADDSQLDLLPPIPGAAVPCASGPFFALLSTALFCLGALVL